MMITKMMKISLFVLVGMISGSSAEDEDWCRHFDNKPNKCKKQPTCKWKPAKGSRKHNSGHCVFRSGLGSRATAPSFVSLEADVEVKPWAPRVRDSWELEDSSWEQPPPGLELEDSWEQPEGIEDEENSEPNGSGSVTKSYLRAN